jgi:hypothetical protein
MNTCATGKVLVLVPRTCTYSSAPFAVYVYTVS